MISQTPKTWERRRIDRKIQNQMALIYLWIQRSVLRLCTHRQISSRSRSDSAFPWLQMHAEYALGKKRSLARIHLFNRACALELWNRFICCAWNNGWTRSGPREHPPASQHIAGSKLNANCVSSDCRSVLISAEKYLTCWSTKNLALTTTCSSQ